MSELIQLIVYACPVGPLATQLDAFFEKSLTTCGPNRAHDYMPHCTLTGFYRDTVDAIHLYIAALEEAFFRSAMDRPEPVITITGMPLLPDWIGLTLVAEEVRQRTAHFARIADSATRPEAIRLKDNLHLSLAYEFPREQYEVLAKMAADRVNPASAVSWELRLYQRHPDNQWTCHYSHALSQSI